MSRKKKHRKDSSFKRVENLSLNEYLNKVEQLRKDGKRISYRKLHWEYLIKNNLLVCPATNKKVYFCGLDYRESSDSYHYNFYSSDNELFTIDHKIPISKGGNKLRFSNVQPMIFEANIEKSNQLIYIK